MRLIASSTQKLNRKTERIDWDLISTSPKEFSPSFIHHRKKCSKNNSARNYFHLFLCCLLPLPWYARNEELFVKSRPSVASFVGINTSTKHNARKKDWTARTLLREWFRECFQFYARTLATPRRVEKTRSQWSCSRNSEVAYEELWIAFAGNFSNCLRDFFRNCPFYVILAVQWRKIFTFLLRSIWSNKQMKENNFLLKF